MNNLRTCRLCKNEKPLTEFYINRRTAYRTDCKKCTSYRTTKAKKREPKGYKCLTVSQMKDIKKRLEHNDKKNSIASDYGISYQNFLYYNRKGYFA